MLIVIVGTRPDLIKIRPLAWQLHREGVPFEIWHCGQHLGTALDQRQAFPIPMRDLWQQPIPRSASEFFSTTMRAVEIGLRDVAAPTVLGYGDTLGALAASLAAVNVGCRLVHVEAGLRSFDLTMPEEIARIQMDAVADFLFCPTTESFDQLSREHVRGAAFLTGNLIADAVQMALDGRADVRHDPQQAEVLVTLHRLETTTSRVRFQAIVRRVGECATRLGYRATFPAHPRVRPMLDAIREDIAGVIDVCDPWPHETFLQRLAKAALVFTDSGGVQEECAILGRKCVTIRRTTERVETIRWGWNLLIDPDDFIERSPESLVADIRRHLDRDHCQPHEYGQDVAQTMATILKAIL